MFKTSQFIAATVLSVAFTFPANAGDIFGLFSCNSSCDAACDGGCCDSPCGTSCCESDCCEPDCCDPGCCDSGCCDSGCSQGSCFAKLFSGLGGCGSNACDSGCCDADCGFDAGCDSCCAQRSCNYVSLIGGWNLLDDYSGENGTVVPTPPALIGTFSDGWGISIAKGRELGNSLRGEVELGFRSNNADVWSVNGVTSDWSGHLFAYTGMINLIKDFETCQCVGITPYVGGGIGLAIFDGDFLTPATEIVIDDEAFAYQFIAGGSRRLSANVDAFAEYRYLATTRVDIQDGPSGAVIDDHEPEFDNIFFGLRIYR